MSVTIQLLTYFCLAAAFLILLHQYIFYEVWFELADIHHETFSIAFFSFAMGILLGSTSKNGRR